MRIIKRAQADKKPDFQGKADEIPAIPRAASHVKKPCTVAWFGCGFFHAPIAKYLPLLTNTAGDFFYEW